MNASKLVNLVTSLSVLIVSSPFWAMSQTTTAMPKQIQAESLTAATIAKTKKLTDQIKIDIKKDVKKGGTGVDGGGGNLRNGEPLSRKTLEEYLANSNRAYYPTSPKKILKYIFNSAYSSYTGFLYGVRKPSQNGWDEMSAHIHAKLFEGKNGLNVYSILNTSKILLQDELCRDPKTGKLGDASANSQTMSVCLSWNGLSKKLFVNNFESYLVPLLVHEYSHLIGTNEVEAHFLEDLVREQTNSEKISIAIEDVEEAFWHDLDYFKERVSQLKQTLSTDAPHAICVKTYKLNTTYETTISYAHGIKNVSLFDRIESIKTETLRDRLLNLMRYCKSADMENLVEDNDPETFAAIDDAYLNNGPELTLLLFIELTQKYINDNYNGTGEITADQKRLLPAEGTIQDVSSGDKNTLLNEITKIEELVRFLSRTTNN